MNTAPRPGNATTGPVSSHRPSYAQREAYRDALAQAYAAGRLDDSDFEDRLNLLAMAESLADLEDLVVDVPRADIEVPAAPAARSAGSRGRTGGSRSRGSSGSSRPGQPNGRHADQGAKAREARLKRGKLLMTGTIIVGLILGAGLGRELVGPPGPGAGTPDSVQAAGGAELPVAVSRGRMSYGYIARIVENLNSRKAESLRFNPYSAGAELLSADKRKLQTISLDDAGEQEEVESEEDYSPAKGSAGLFTVEEVDPAAVYAAILAAPGVAHARTGRDGEEGLEVNAVRIDRLAGTPFAGQRAGALTISVTVNPRGTSGQYANLRWSGDGKHLLEARR